MRPTIYILAGVAGFFIGFTAVMAVATSIDEDPTVVTLPYNMQCEEDELILGTGDFDGVSWDEYNCVVIDDLVVTEMGCPVTDTIAACATRISGAWSATPGGQGSEQ